MRSVDLEPNARWTLLHSHLTSFVGDGRQRRVEALEQTARRRSTILIDGHTWDGECGRADVGRRVERGQVQRDETLVVLTSNLLFGQNFDGGTPLRSRLRQPLDLLQQQNPRKRYSLTNSRNGNVCMFLAFHSDPLSGALRICTQATTGIAATEDMVIIQPRTSAHTGNLYSLYSLGV